MKLWRVKRFSIFGTGLSCSFLLSHFALLYPEARVLLICLYLGAIVGSIAIYLISENQKSVNSDELVFGAIALLIGVFYALGVGKAWIVLRLLLWILLLIITVSTWIYFTLPQPENNE
jgi:hypothetical protein